MNLLALIFILFILLLIYFYVKNMDQGSRMMKILSRISLSKDNHLMVIKVIDKFYLCSSNQKGFNIIEELEEEKVYEYINGKRTTLFKKG